jgi:hypothetical protein
MLAVVIGRRAQAVPAAEALDDGARSSGIKLKYKLRIAYPTPPFFWQG